MTEQEREAIETHSKTTVTDTGPYNDAETTEGRIRMQHGRKASVELN